MKLKALLLKCDPLFDHRNIVTTIVLYGIFLSAVLSSLIATFGLVDQFVEFASSPFRDWLFDGDEDTFCTWLSYNYRKGFIPGWLICIISGISNYRIIRGHRDGICLMLVSFCVVCIPTVFVELEEFICFSLPLMAAVIVYFAFLFLPKRRVSYWRVCKPAPKWLVITAVVTAIVWVFMLISSCRQFELYQSYSF
ncbi:MAG: hypothetical protein NC402_00945 [Prevotella sp.]|nr:hypothetical protein [Prevotella sp.]MCM1074373.1 hypothetical protein [Ruminococcus sp.]